MLHKFVEQPSTPYLGEIVSQPWTMHDMLHPRKISKYVKNSIKILTRLPLDGSSTQTQTWHLATSGILKSTHAKSCENCNQILGEIQASHVQNSKLSIDLRETLDPILNFSGNEQTICGWIENLLQSSDEQLFRNFGEEVKAATSQLAEEWQWKIMNFYEEIVFRVLYFKYGRHIEIFQNEFQEVVHLLPRNQEQTQLRLSLGVVGASVPLSTFTKQNRDIPASPRIFVKSADAEITNFSLLAAFLHSRLSCGLQERLILSYLHGKMERMFKYTADHPDCIVGRRNVMFSYLVSVRDFVSRRITEVGYDQLRVQILELIGEPGLGKSRGVQSQAFFLHAFVPVIPLRQLIYVRSKDRFWNGYFGQPIVLYDDITHSSEGKSKVDYVSELIDIGSGTFESPPMAFDKNTKFSSIFVFVTSNIPFLHSCVRKETATALKRRMISGPCRPYAKCAVKLDGIFRYRYMGGLRSSIELFGRPIVSYIAETLAIMAEVSTLELTIVGPKSEACLEDERKFALLQMQSVKVEEEPRESAQSDLQLSCIIDESPDENWVDAEINDWTLGYRPCDIASQSVDEIQLHFDQLRTNEPSCWNRLRFFGFIPQNKIN